MSADANFFRSAVKDQCSYEGTSMEAGNNTMRGNLCAYVELTPTMPGSEGRFRSAMANIRHLHGLQAPKPTTLSIGLQNPYLCKFEKIMIHTFLTSLQMY